MTSKPRTKKHRKWLWWVLGIFLVLGLIGSIEDKASDEEKTPNRLAASVSSTLETEGGTYIGPAIDYVYEGTGEFQYLSGGVYEGEFSESKRHGEGTFSFENGDTYTGNWDADTMVQGTYTFADGRTYEGSFKDNKFNDGTFTVSTFPENLPYSSFTATFKGGVVDTIDLELLDGSYYRGELTGKAEARYPSGNTYSGAVKDGKRSGTGTFTWYDNGVKAASYTGNWSDDLMSGTGKYFYTAAAYPCLEGTFEKGHVTGTATYYKEAGNAFSTTWVNGRCTGVTEI